MPKALVVYCSRTGGTLKIAELVAGGLRFDSAETVLKDSKNIKNKNDLAGYGIYAFGSPAYHGEMLQAMKTFLFLAEKAGLV
jgi:flavodoxin